MSSMPTDSLKSLSSMPKASRISGGMEPCVCTSGYVTRLSVPPRLSANRMSFVRSNTASARSCVSVLNEIMAPKPVVWRRDRS